MQKLQRTIFSVLILFLLLLATYVVVILYPEVLWFKSFGYDNIWWFTFKSKWFTFITFFVTAFVFLFLNVTVAKRVSEKNYSTENLTFNTPFAVLNQFFEQLLQQNKAQSQLPLRIYYFFLNALILFFAVVFGLLAKSWWQDIYAYIHQVAFQVTDPLFQQDLSFYFFSLPFFEGLQAWAMGLCILTLGVVGWIYFSKNILVLIFSTSPKIEIGRAHV